MNKKVILHIDGDAFFVACEVSLRPEYRNKPVVTGADRSIITALSYEAKALGLVRTMPVYEVKKKFPQVTILSPNYYIYSIFSRRMFSIVERYTQYIEEYSVDECFADLSHFENPENVALQIQKDIYRELGISVSVGLASTKVLAKIASKQNKPHGLTSFLKDRNVDNISISKVWGIGHSASAQLAGFGIITIKDFLAKDRSWICQHLSKPYQTIWYELQGVNVLNIEGDHDPQKSIAYTRSFLFSTKNKNEIWSHLVKNIEAVCLKARKSDFDAKQAHIFIKTKSFEYSSASLVFDFPLSDPISIIKIVHKKFEELFKKNIEYRATGITLQNLVPRNSSVSLFTTDSNSTIFDIVDKLSYKYGEGIIKLAASAKKDIEKRPLYILSLGTVR